MRTKTEESLLGMTCRGLDCIDLTYYVCADKPLDDSMQEIQLDFEYDHLPGDAMAIFRRPAFHHDVFRAMDEQDFEEYLLARYEDEDRCLLTEGFWYDEEEFYDEDTF